jgi:pimeloyl-ACP methyl ester carboxylesterase
VESGRRHPYLLGASEAAGVLDIVQAARNLFGSQLSDRFAIVGHSQGGQAALFAASHAPSWIEELKLDLNLVAVAAIAPANHLLGLVKVGAALPTASEGYAFTPLLLCGAMAGAEAGGNEIRPERVLSEIAYPKYWEHVDQRCRAGLSLDDSWGGLRGDQQFRDPYPVLSNSDQQLFDAQVAAMNPNVTLTVPARITQAEDDERVHANFTPPNDVLKGTDDLLDELKTKNSESGQPLEYEKYPALHVTPDPRLGVHFATINHDLPKLINWLRSFLEPAP